MRADRVIACFLATVFNAPHREEFDTEFMRALYQTGFDMAAKGYLWHFVLAIVFDVG